ncbi:MAG: trypsin-like peptidase domain-containing protein [Chlamydiales bacterium]|nr:trypsin-like peptidase domain-containing protein [Chlamydiales bacterium]
MYEVARKVDLVLFKVIGLKSPDYFETLPPDETLDVGEEVYFGGFPLHMSNPAFHKGFISSKQEVDGRLYYTIDGTVVPGHSGGPVVVNKGGSTGLKIYLVGIILSEAVSLDREHQRLIEANRRYKQKCPNPIPPKFTIFNAKSDEKIEKDLVDLILAVDNFVSRNLSTGIGQMIESSAIYDLINNQYQETEAVKTNSVNPEDFPIGVKNEKLPGMLSQDNDYLNWYHRRVKGNYLCVKILNVMIKGGRDEITAEQEKRLWDYYEKNVFTKRAAERLEREKGKVTKAELTNDPKGNLENILHSIKEKHSALSRPNRPLTDKAIKNRQLEISNLLIKGNESLELIENEDEKAIFALRLSNYRDGSA